MAVARFAGLMLNRPSYLGFRAIALHPGLYSVARIRGLGFDTRISPPLAAVFFVREEVVERDGLVCIINPRDAASLRQPDAPQKIDKSWIRAQVVEGRVDPQSGELIGPLSKGLVQQCQRLRVIAKSGVDPGDVDRGDVAPLGDL